MYEFAFINIIVRNMNIIVSIVQPTFQQKATFKYCDK